MSMSSARVRAYGLGLLVAVLAGLAWLLPPMAQSQAYHDLADQRACFGLPNCLDTASNAGFVLVGAMGLWFLRRSREAAVFLDRREAWPYRLFFMGAVLIGIGSGYYHLAPDNDRLLWDRLAMMLAFMAWLGAVVSERVGPKTGLRLLPLFVAAGVGSVIYWGWSEAQGVGDLRPYLLMQLYPMLLIPLLLGLYPPRYSGGHILLAVIGLYILALLGDQGDRQVFALTGSLVSGHTMKHIVAAAAVWGVLRYLQRRQPLPINLEQPA